MILWRKFLAIESRDSSFNSFIDAIQRDDFWRKS